MLLSGTTIGRYVVQRKLAEGGMAEIYLASAIGAEGFSKDVVIKVVRSFLATDQQFVQMFISEARLASRLNHANIVQIFDFGKHDTTYYLAMEYVRGASLSDLRKRCREQSAVFPPAVAAKICSEVARGLHYAHNSTEGGQRLGVVHRDVTPHNVLLSFDGAVKLTDFGIAKATTSHTAPGMLKGKFAYMSPEQSRGEKVDARTDIFALGIILWELLTGSRLFDGDTDVAVLRAVQEALIAPPSRINPEIPEALSEIVMRALMREPNDRFATAAQFERALATWVMKTADTLDEASVAHFLQAMYRDEYQAEIRHFSGNSSPAVAPHDDPAAVAPADTLRAHRSEHFDALTIAPHTQSETPIKNRVALATPNPVISREAESSSLNRAQTEVAVRLHMSPAGPAVMQPQPVEPAPTPSRGDGDSVAREAGGIHLKSKAPAIALSVAALIAVVALVFAGRRDSKVVTDQIVAAPPAIDVAAEPSTSIEVEFDAGTHIVADQPNEPTPTTEAPIAIAPQVGTNEVPSTDAGVTSRPARGFSKLSTHVASSRGTLVVKATPYATVLIGKRLLGEVVGTRSFPLSAGSYLITLKHNKVTRSTPVLIRPDEISTVDFNVDE